MKKCRVVTRLLLLAMVAAYLVFMPGYLRPRLVRVHSGVRPQDMGDPVGIVTVWHIVGFKPYSGSVSEWLKTRAGEVEKKHYGLFYDIVPMTVAEYEERRSGGGRADIYSFPSGLMSARELAPLGPDTGALDGEYENAGRKDGQTLAVPYLSGAYALYENVGLSQRTGGEDALDAALASERIAGDAVALAANGFFGEATTTEDFKSGKCAFALADCRLASELMLLQQKGKGVVFNMYPAGEWNDLVQFIGVGADTDAEKRSAAEWLIESILSSGAQKKLAPMGLMAVTTVEGFDEGLPDMLKGIAVRPKRSINTFSYNEYAAELRDLATSAEGGADSGRKAFEECVTRLFMEGK